MPDTSGPELARRIAAIRPAMKALFVSGYTDDAILRHGVLAEQVAFLGKPFKIDVLGHKIREVLAAPRVPFPIDLRADPRALPEDPPWTHSQIARAV
jgi:DNA-binding NarL/FixJ family response regulator